MHSLSTFFRTLFFRTVVEFDRSGLYSYLEGPCITYRIVSSYVSNTVNVLIILVRSCILFFLHNDFWWKLRAPKSSQSCVPWSGLLRMKKSPSRTDHNHRLTSHTVLTMSNNKFTTKNVSYDHNGWFISQSVPIKMVAIITRSYFTRCWQWPKSLIYFTNDVNWAFDHSFASHTVLTIMSIV